MTWHNHVCHCSVMSSSESRVLVSGWNFTHTRPTDLQKRLLSVTWTRRSGLRPPPVSITMECLLHGVIGDPYSIQIHTSLSAVTDHVHVFLSEYCMCIRNQVTHLKTRVLNTYILTNMGKLSSIKQTHGGQPFWLFLFRGCVGVNDKGRTRPLWGQRHTTDMNSDSS